jgi:transposase
MQIHSVGIDLAETTFHLVALGVAGNVLVRKKFAQKQLLTCTANIQMSLIGPEACSGAHLLGRALHKQGYDVRLIAAQFESVTKLRGAQTVVLTGVLALRPIESFSL